MKIFITGKGQLGTYYKDYFEKLGDTVMSAASADFDIRDEGAFKSAIEAFGPDIVIHTAAKTNIDWCEQNKTACFEINTLATDLVGKICQEKNLYLVYLSSGCVLESKNAQDLQTEEVQISPLCFYSWTKAWGEQMLTHRANRSGLKVLTLRPRQLISAKVDPRNAITKMLTYTKFIDTPNSCTIVEDLLMATAELIKKNATGVYNVVNPGVTTPFEMANLLKEIVKPEMEFMKISKAELNAMTLAERVDAVLDGTKLTKAGIVLREIHERMREIMTELKSNLRSVTANSAMAQTQKETAEKLGLKNQS